MSFFNSIKRSLGFGGNDEDDENIYADTADASEQSESTTDTTSKDKTADISPLTFDPLIQQRIFTRVLEIFNDSLPKFINDTIDREAQTKFLLEALDQDIKKYLDELGRTAEAHCEKRWEQSRSALTSELETLRTHAGAVEKKSGDILQKQLSADRQKRALSERVHDLETQIAKLEAEREQFELENRSLVNKLKVMNVQQEDVDRLQSELKELRDNPNESHAKEVESLRSQIEEMNIGIDSLKEQNRVSNDVITELRQRLSDANKELEKRENYLEEAAEMRKEYDEASDKLDEIAQVMASNEEQIKIQKELVATRDAEIEALRKTIAENLRMQGEREKELQDQIDALRSTTVKITDIDDIPTVSEEDSAPQISEAELSAIEQTFESGEWFTNIPPAETPSMRPAEEDSDFGYRKPKRKSPQANNDAQLSLF